MTVGGWKVKLGNVFDTSMYDLFMGADMEKYHDFDNLKNAISVNFVGFAGGVQL